MSQNDTQQTGAQRTLTGETTDDDRPLPSTMLFCEQCDQRVLRSRRDEHPHELGGADDAPSAQMKKLEEDSSEGNTASEAEYRGGYFERVSRSPDLGADRGFDSRLAHRVATYAN